MIKHFVYLQIMNFWDENMFVGHHLTCIIGLHLALVSYLLAWSFFVEFGSKTAQWLSVSFAKIRNKIFRKCPDGGKEQSFVLLSGNPERHGRLNKESERAKSEKSKKKYGDDEGGGVPSCRQCVLILKQRRKKKGKKKRCPKYFTDIKSVKSINVNRLYSRFFDTS